MTVKLSTEYQVLIPRDVREPMGLKPGAEFRVLARGDRIELIPTQDIRELRGILKGTGAEIERRDVPSGHSRPGEHPGEDEDRV